MGNFISTSPEPEWKSDARCAMEAGAFCAICGGLFDVEGDGHNRDPKDPCFNWLHTFRVLGRTSDVAARKVASEESTPYNESKTEGVFLSGRALFCTTGSQYFQVPSQDDEHDVWFDTPFHVSHTGSLFPLHEACISIACKCIIHFLSRRPKSTSRPTLAILSDLLNTRLFDRYDDVEVVPENRNDLFDLCSTSDLYGPRSVLAMNNLEWWAGDYEKFYANPIDALKTSSFVHEVLRTSPRTKVQEIQALTYTRQPEGLECLPNELLTAVCDHLSTTSIIALHRTSKALALSIPLGSAFWRDSLRDGSLHPHIWDLDTKCVEQLLQDTYSQSSESSDVVDWRGAAQLLAMKRFPVHGRDPRLLGIPHSLWNRCRIWSTIEEVLEKESRIDPTTSRSGLATSFHELWFTE